MPYRGLTVAEARRRAACVRAAGALARAEDQRYLDEWFAEEADFARHCEAFRHGHLGAAEDHWQKILARRAIAALTAGGGGRP